MCLINTLKAAAMHPGSARPWLGAGRGGLSGSAVRPVAMQQTLAVAEAVSIPLIAMGGVATGADAFEMLAAGATLVGVGTESFRDPRAGERVRLELARNARKERLHIAGGGRFDGLWGPGRRLKVLQSTVL